MKTIKTIVITGTHHTPAIELIQLLKADPNIIWQVFYIGHRSPTDTHIAHTIIPKLGVTFYNLNCGKFDRKDYLKTILGLPSTFLAIIRSIKLLYQLKPNLVVSFGGYVSVPVIISSWLLRLPSITHEQTLTNSLSTRINAHFVNKIALTFNNYSQLKQLPNSKIIVTGNLIRDAIFKNSTTTFKELIPIIKKKPLLIFMGGNQGSTFLNQLVVQLLPQLTRFTIIHQTGNQFPATQATLLRQSHSNYFPVNIIEMDDFGWAINNAEIIVSRSGANACQEYEILHKKVVLIPLPFAQQNEQLLNAQWLQKVLPQSTIIIPQVEVKPVKILNSIERLLTLKNSFPLPPPITNHPLFQLIHDYV